MTEGIIMPPTHLTVPAQRRPEHSEEWALVDRAQAGDRAAFAQLYRQNYPAVVRFLSFRVGDGLAEDFAQTVFTRALRSLAGIRYAERPVIAWLLTIAANLTRDHYKSAAARLSSSTDIDILAADLVADDDPEREVIRSAEAATLERAMARLTPDQRLCLVLRFQNGLSIAETALVMCRPEGAIKALQYRASRQLMRDPEIRALRVEVDR